ncbi:hypothetical protein [Arthrobacter sp.]|uniref:hypothetical protein n=1 Tax=Arthrobacter sp. TaxID=1667 RepID=UPI0028963AD6|nr:hypothetical protein [Arthrobacter sp.]
MSDSPVRLIEPTPDVIVEFIGRVAGAPWPDDSAGFTAYFDSLGCTAGESAEYSDPVPGSTCGPLTCPGTFLDHGSWAAYNGQLFALNFFFYSGSRRLAEVGFGAVRDRLNDIYGSPADEGTDANGDRSAYWTPGENSIELYGHVTLAPALQIGLGRRDVEELYSESARHSGPHTAQGGRSGPVR